MKNKKQSKIKYFDVWGLRKDKYKFLENHDIKNTKFYEPGNNAKESSIRNFLKENWKDKYRY